MTTAVILIYRLVLFGACTYLVGWQGWSPWWFLFAFFITPFLDGTEDKK